MASSNGKPAQAEEGKGAAEGSIGGYESLHRLLEANLSPELFQVPSITPPGRGRPDSSRRVVVRARFLVLGLDASLCAGKLLDKPNCAPERAIELLLIEKIG